MGDAIIPPKISPKIISKLVTPIRVIKVKELASVTKNSARFTEPIVCFGFLPLAIKVEDTIYNNLNTEITLKDLYDNILKFQMS